MIAAIEADRLLEKSLKDQVKDLEAQDADLRRRIEDKERSLGDADKKAREAISRLRNRESELLSEAKLRSKIEKDIEARLRRADDLDREVEKLSADYAEMERRRGQLEGEVVEWEKERNRNAAFSKGYETRIKIYQMKLNTGISHQEIKNFLLNLVPEKDKTKTLEVLMSGKIKEERELIELLKSFGADNTAESEKLMQFIQQDQQFLSEVMKKFLDWQKTINEYAGGELQISDLRTKIAEFEGKRAEFDALVA